MPIKSSTPTITVIYNYFFSILKTNARVINISSNLGHTLNLKNKEWMARLTKKDIKRSDIDVFVEWFLDSVKNVIWKQEDFFQVELLADWISKIALCAFTIVQQNDSDRNIASNSVHPGFVQTGMTGGKGTFTVEESSKALVYLALDIDQSVKLLV